MTEHAANHLWPKHSADPSVVVGAGCRIKRLLKQLQRAHGSDTAAVIMCIVIFLMTSSVAYVASMLGWPARVAPGMMMETFNQNVLEIEEIVSCKLRRLEGKVGSCFDLGAAQTAGILSHDQTERLEYIFPMQH